MDYFCLKQFYHITQGKSYEMIFLKLFYQIVLQWRFTGCTLYSNLDKPPFHRFESNFVLVKIYGFNDAGTMTSYIIEGSVHILAKRNYWALWLAVQQK